MIVSVYCGIPRFEVACTVIVSPTATFVADGVTDAVTTGAVPVGVGVLVGVDVLVGVGRAVTVTGPDIALALVKMKQLHLGSSISPFTLTANRTTPARAA